MNSSDIDIQDEEGWTPISYATYFGHVKCVQILIQYGSDPNSSEMIPCCLAAKSGGNSELISMFPDNKHLPNKIPPHFLIDSKFT